MKTLKVISTFVLSIFLISCDTSSQVTENEDLITSIKESFASPPESARPWVYWFWLNGNVTREGITADLEAMKRVGIGGVLIMDVNQGTPPSSISFMDEQWQEMFRFSVQEANRLGLEINMNNDAGWNGSGGPWITPEYAMQTITFSETRVQGGNNVNINLPQPPTKGDYYRDVAVLAVQYMGLQTVHMMDANPSLNISLNRNMENTSFPSSKNPLVLAVPKQRELPSLDIRFNEPFQARTLEINVSGLKSRVQGDLQISNDGKEFRSVKAFSLRNVKNIIEFDLLKAKWFRIKFLKVHDEQGEFTINNLDINPRYRIKNLQQKALFSLSWYADEGQSAPINEEALADAVLSRDKVIDLTQYMDANGHLQWNAPEGKWSIFRYGHTFTGMNNSPAALGGEGPDCDKLSKEGIRKHYDGFLKKLVELAGAEAGKTLSTFHIDSWELDAQNWTRNMGEEFRRRRGYDITPYLPVFSGAVIGSLQQTERFLWDLRKTVSELMVENYVAEMQKICHENGMQFSMESYTTIGNDLDAANWVDEPIAEFWTPYAWKSVDSLNNTMKSMASAAHINNRPIVAAESFTSDDSEKWLLHPASIKALGDSAFCYGINKLIFHRYAMQPWLNQKPGMTMGPWGLHYERTQTWWKYSLPWHTYLARSQYLLRQGKFVADVLNLQPEEPNYRFKNLNLSGYDYNACSPDAFQKVTVEDGLLVDGAGNKYKLLVLTQLGTMSEQMLSHIRELVIQGASVLGEPPMATPGLTDYPNADVRLKLLVEELWGRTPKQENKAGKGRVFNGISPEEALKRMGIAPDFISENKLNYIHREINGADVYFVANGADSAIVANCTFRVKGKRPQWWNPETGETKPLANYAPTNEGTIRVPLVLGPSGSGFVVFVPDTGTNPERVAKITRNGEVLLEEGIAYYDEKTGNPTNGFFDFINGEISLPGAYVFTKASGKTFNVNISPEQKAMEVSGPWKLKFPKGSGVPLKINVNKLESWTSLPDKEANYFSGTGSYFKTVSIPSGLLKTGTKLYLDLGKVEVVARVFINGEEAGTCWKPPYRIDVTSMVHEGENDLRVDVANLWVNRQIGDEYLPEDSERNPNGTLKTWPDWVLEDKESPTGRQSFTTWRLWKKDDPLLESGLIGPVTLQQTKSIGY